jgi:hypothetical protein
MLPWFESRGSDHKVLFASTSNKSEAHYVCAILNSPVSSSIVRAYTIPTQISTHVIANLAIPKFDRKNRAHRILAELSEQAHVHAARGETSRLNKVESQINLSVGRIWGLRQKDLASLSVVIR